MRNALKYMKNGKATGTDNIPIEFFKNMNDENLHTIRKLFSIAILRQEILQQWKDDRLTLIYKGKGGREKLDN